MTEGFWYLASMAGFSIAVVIFIECLIRRARKPDGGVFDL